MGVFDNFPDDDEFNSPQQGLIARLMQSQGVQSQYSPSAGFPASPMDANASAPAPQQATPIPVGNNYQMPRIGAAAGFTLPPGQLDPDTGEHVQPAQAAAPAAPATNPISSFLGKAAAGLHSVAQGGSLYGAVTGQPDDPQSLQKQQLQKQYQALVDAGVPQKQAVLAVLNPEAAKVIIPQYVGADKNKFVQMKDGLGGDHPAFVNAENQTINGMSIADYNKANNTNATAGLGDMSLSGKDYLNSIPAQQRGTVQSMIDGRMAPPNGMARKSAYWQNMIAAANHVDPSFDETQWPARVTGMKSFRSGADAGTVRSANQVLGHISDLTDMADELHNGNYPSLNFVKNTFNSATGGDASNNWVTQAHAVADELSSFMKGAGHSSDTEIQQWKESLSPNMSPTQQRGAIKTLMGIYDHALSALEDKRTGAVGSVAAERMGPLVTTAGQSAMDKVRNWSTGPAAPAPGKTSTGVKWSVVQ
jgi:hypothetical protein